MALPSRERVNARAAKDKAFIKRALKNPGLRSRLDAKYLPADKRATIVNQRALNTRLNAPITPGSPTTERDLAHIAEAATTVRYAPQERDFAENIGRSVQTERDTGTFYDQYIQQLRQHQSNVAAYQQGAQQALAQTAAGVTGLAGQQGAELQNAATQRAAQQGVAQAGDLSGLASNAAAVRQQLVGSFQAQQAGQGAAANTYADALANVVAPGQKLSAQAQAIGRTTGLRKDLSKLKAEEGAYNQTFRDTRRQDEFKNVLAQQTLTGNQAIAGAKVAADAAANTPAAAAAKTGATAAATQAAKYGYTPHQWALLGPNGRQNAIEKFNRKSGGGGKGPGDHYGYTDEQWAGMSSAQKRKAYQDWNAAGRAPGKGKPGTPGAGPDWQTNAQQGSAASDAVNLKDLANRAKAGTKFSPGPKDRPGTGVKLDRHQAAAKIQQSAKVSDPVLLTAALDAAYDAHLSKATVKRLIAAGYEPSKIASALGVPTAGRWRPATRPRTTSPGSGGARATR